MAENQSPKTQNSSDEIDLGQLFQLIGKGFNAIFRFFLRIFVYLKKNIFILIGLVFLGLAVGFGLSKVISKKLKIEVIVKPQFESKNYLYDVIGEIQANIEGKDTLFFKSIGINNIDFNGLEVSISPVNDNKESTDSEIKYLELLQSFENTGAIEDIVRAELQNKSSFNHRVIIYYKNATVGKDFAIKLLEYINSNEYFDSILEVNLKNATSRIEKDEQLLKQVDEIIANYSNKMATVDEQNGNDRIILDNQETVNITGLFSLKNDLIRDIELKNIELLQNNVPIKIINFGKPQPVKRSFFSKKLVLFPSIFLTLFFIGSILKYLNKKSKDI